MLTKATRYAPPSALFRAAVSLVLLLGSYALLFGVAASLFVIPIAIAAAGGIGFRTLVVFAIFWLPAGLLVMSAFTPRRAPFVAPRRRLAKEEAPALFEIVERLAQRAGTAAPTEIYLVAVPDLAVTEVGGIMRSRRVMIVGAPLLHFLSVDEFRAGVAHELGHFLGGDTRLTAFSAQTHALFESVVVAVARDPFRVGTQHYAIESGLAFAQAIGHLLVRAYSRLYFRLTRPIGRRQELAADALSAALVSPSIASSALETVAICAPLYLKYLEDDVGFAVKQGAMPADLAPGFRRFRDELLPTERGQRFIEAVRTRATDAHDTHPALSDRLRALADQSAVNCEHDQRPASTLLADEGAFDAWLVEATRELVISALFSSGMPIPTIRTLPWAKIPQEIYAPGVREAARRAAERLHPLLPSATTLGSMFASVWRRMDTGDVIDLVLRLEPTLDRLGVSEGRRRALEICRDLLGTLFQGALLERGAVVQASFGESSLTLRLGEERLNVLEMLRALATNSEAGRAALHQWAERLEVPHAGL